MAMSLLVAREDSSMAMAMSLPQLTILVLVMAQRLRCLVVQLTILAQPKTLTRCPLVCCSIYQSDQRPAGGEQEQETAGDFPTRPTRFVIRLAK